MGLSGNLAEINLASVFQNLEQNNATGTLEVHYDDRIWPIFLESGRISTIIPGGDWKDWYGAALFRTTTISKTEFDKVAQKLKKGQCLVNSLKRRKLADKAALDAALRFVQEEALYELFFLESGRFSFNAGERSAADFPPPFDKIDMRINPNSVLMEAARRTDELSQLQTSLGSVKGVYVPAPDYRGDLSALSPEQQGLLALLDGSRDIEKLCCDSGYGRFQTCVLAAQLLERYAIVPVRAEDHVRLGDASHLKGNDETTTFHYQRALDLRRTDSRTRCKLAEILAETGHLEEAVTQFKLLGTQVLERGHWQEATKAFRQAASLAPKDVSVHEKLFDIYRSHSDFDHAKNCGEQLAQLQSSLGLHDRSQSVLRELSRLFPGESLSYQQRIADGFIAMGQVDAAIDCFHKAADQALKSLKDDSAARFFEEILRLDSSNQKAQKQLGDIRSGQLEQRRKRWALLRRVFVYSVIFCAVMAWVAYDNQARKQLQETIEFCFEDVERGDVDVAGQRMSEFRLQYPYTMAAKHAASHQSYLLKLAQQAALRQKRAEAYDEDH
jgi:tetratricopeptide (TPR) repeat protein